MKAFATGSRVYGSPTKKSDIDLVVLVSPKTMDVLCDLADEVGAKHTPARHSDPGPADVPAGRTESLKFGNLNLICVSDLISYAVWLKGTQELSVKCQKEGPVSRDAAMDHFRELREKHGLRRKPGE